MHGRRAGRLANLGVARRDPTRGGRKHPTSTGGALGQPSDIAVASRMRLESISELVPKNPSGDDGPQESKASGESDAEVAKGAKEWLEALLEESFDGRS